MKLRIWLAALLISAAALGTRHSAPVVQAAREAGQDAPASTLDDLSQRRVMRVKVAREGTPRVSRVSCTSPFELAGERRSQVQAA